MFACKGKKQLQLGGDANFTSESRRSSPEFESTCPSIPSSSLRTLNPQNPDHERQTPASRCSRSPVAAETQRRVQTPLSGPRCSARPGPAATQPRIGLRGSRLGAPLLPPRAQPRPAPPPARASPVCGRAFSPDGGRREVPPPPPPPPERADRASASSDFTSRPPAPRRKPAGPRPPPTLPAAAEGLGSHGAAHAPWRWRTEPTLGCWEEGPPPPGSPVASATQSGLATWELRRPQLGAEWHPGRRENVSAPPPFSHTHTESQPFRR